MKDLFNDFVAFHAQNMPFVLAILLYILSYSRSFNDLFD